MRTPATKPIGQELWVSGSHSPAEHRQSVLSRPRSHSSQASLAQPPAAGLGSAGPATRCQKPRLSDLQPELQADSFTQLKRPGLERPSPRSLLFRPPAFTRTMTRRRNSDQALIGRRPVNHLDPGREARLGRGSHPELERVWGVLPWPGCADAITDHPPTGIHDGRGRAASVCDRPTGRC